jgi:Histone methylation protein DOT1
MNTEDITLEYAFAQSVLYKIYGEAVQETGHRTRGHNCLTNDDKASSKATNGSLLYGELLPRGANKALGRKHLQAANAKSLFDLGMGIGKVVIQAFLQFDSLEFVYGIELSGGRYQ